MGYIFAFILGFGACAILWALREVERAPVFKAAAAEIERLSRRDQLARKVIRNVHAGMSGLFEEFSLGGRAALPAPASPKAEGLEVNMQHFSQRSQRITARLTGLPGSGGPNFYGGNNEH
jgi:hypothetical protein